MRLYEHGVAVDDATTPAPRSLSLIATTELPVYSDFHTTIVDENQQSLTERIDKVSHISGAHRDADYYEETDLSYVLRACAYHLERIGEEYRTVTCLFEDLHPAETTSRGNTSSGRVYFETDAFLAGARRVYEQIGRVVWKHYGKGTRPRSYSAVIDAAQDRLPPAFVSACQASWQQHGVKLKGYRDCIAHNTPVNDGHTTCWLSRVEQRWAMTVPLPANPDAKSRRHFNFAEGPDALSYCHELLCHLCGLAETTTALPPVRSHLDKPSI